MTENPKLTIEIKNTQPVQLSDLTAAFKAYAEEYQRFAQEDGHDISGENVQLYVHELRTGSIIADLVSLADQASIILDHLDVLVGFTSHMNEVALHFLRTKTKAEFTPTKSELKNYLNIFKPIAKDSGSQINNIVQDGGTVIQQFNIGSDEATNILRNVALELAKKPNEEEERFTDEALTVYQARDSKSSDIGNLGHIDRYSDKPLKLRFATEEVRLEIMEREENVFHLVFMVDGKVIMAEGRPAAYLITNVSDTFEKPYQD